MPIEPSHPLVDIKDAVAEFVAKESELAAAEIKPAAKAAGIGTGLFAAAGVFVFHALWMFVILFALAISLLLSAVAKLSLLPSLTLGFLASMLFSLLVALVLFTLGRGKFRDVKKPEATIAEAKATLDAVVTAISASGGKSKDVVVRAEDLPQFRDADLNKSFDRP